MQEIWVGSLGREDPLDEDMATYSSIHAWEIPWTEKPGGQKSMGLQRVGHNWNSWACPQVKCFTELSVLRAARRTRNGYQALHLNQEHLFTTPQPLLLLQPEMSTPPRLSVWVCVSVCAGVSVSVCICECVCNIFNLVKNNFFCCINQLWCMATDMTLGSSMS